MMYCLSSAGSTNKEFNFRHDWNSLITHNQSLQMKYYSKKYFPHADDYVSIPLAGMYLYLRRCLTKSITVVGTLY